MAVTEWTEDAQRLCDYMQAQGRPVSVDELQAVFPEVRLRDVAHAVYLYQREQKDQI